MRERAKRGGEEERQRSSQPGHWTPSKMRHAMPDCLYILIEYDILSMNLVHSNGRVCLSMGCMHPTSTPAVEATRVVLEGTGGGNWRRVFWRELEEAKSRRKFAGHQNRGKRHRDSGERERVSERVCERKREPRTHAHTLHTHTRTQHTHTHTLTPKQSGGWVEGEIRG